ncbi:MAG: tetratricopeptide repeat protein [Steroidobacteraceae bacterium]
MTSDSQQLIQQAIKLQKAGKLDQATGLYLQVLQRDPDNFDALNLSGAAALQTGDVVTAIDLINQALTRGRLPNEKLAQHKRLGDAYNNLAVALQKQRRFDDALVALRKALEYRGNDADMLANVGLLLKELGQYEESEAMLRRSIALNPRHVRALIALGLIQYITSRGTEAADTVSQALRADPGSPAGHTLQGNLLVARGQFDAALRSFETALSHDATFPDAFYNRGLLYLNLGRFGQAWHDIYHYHPTRRGVSTVHQPPLPARLDGKRVFVNRNQGIGDELFYLRFLPALKARGAYIAYRTEDRMLGFMQRLGLFDELIPYDVKKFNADHIVLLDHLPFLLQMGDDDVPPSLKLMAQPDSLRRMALRLQKAGPGPYLGVTWRAGRMRSEVDFRKESTEILFKEIAPEQLGAALAHWPGTVLILQRNPIADEVARFQQALGRTAVDCSDINNDLEDMLALLSLMERYVTVSNTNLHMRATVGLPSHVLVPHPPEWRWGVGPGRSAWFPENPVYRQNSSGDWQPALAQLSSELLR